MNNRKEKVDKILKNYTKKDWIDNYTHQHQLNQNFNLGLPLTNQQLQQPLLPIAKRVFAQTIGLNLVPVKPIGYPNSFKNTTVKNKHQLRKEKLKAVFENPLKRKIKGAIKSIFKKIFSIFKKKKTNSTPEGIIFYMDFKYGNTSNKIYKKKLFKKRDR